MKSKIARFAIPLLALALPVMSIPALALPNPVADGSAPLLPPGSALDVRTFHIHDARLPGPFCARQDVTAWQVTQGSWKGQILDGLCLVLVQSTTESGTPARQTNCYVSDYATTAQRRALLDAFLASNPQTISPRDAASLRLEPGVITLEVQGQTVIIHLGLVA